MRKILVVEDDKRISELLEVELHDHGFEVEVAEDGEQGLQRLQEASFTLAVVDIMLPKMTGLDICRKLREDNNSIPIVLLTAKSEEIDRVLGLQLGADDYLCKPFSVHELVARIQAILRRVERSSDSPLKGQVEYRDLVICSERRVVTMKGEPIVLTTKEFDILEFLAQRAGNPYTRDQLLEELWGYSTEGYHNNVTTHINRLRKKIEPVLSRPIYIRTLRGFGYYFGDREE